MKGEIKTFFLNVVAGVLAYYVTKFLDANNLPLLSYLVFGLYIVFLFAASYFHFQNRPKPVGEIVENSREKQPEKNIENNKPEIFHKILQTVAKLASQHVESSPKKIGEIIGENPQIVLAYLNEMVYDFLVAYVNNGNPADINTSFFIAYHDNPWMLLKIQSS